MRRFGSEYMERIAQLGDIAFELGDRPNDASERLPFVEGYAHVGRWEDAARLSLEIIEEQPPMWITVCRTWKRLDETTVRDEDRQGAIEKAYEALPCDDL